MEAPDHLCVLQVDTSGPVDNVSWYDIWAAAVALTGICIRNGQTGKATDLGELRRYQRMFYADISLQVKMVTSSSRCGDRVWHLEFLSLR